MKEAADLIEHRQGIEQMVEQRFQPGGPAKYQLKDTGTALAFARSLGLDLAVLGVVDRLYADMVAHGDGELDHSAIIREIRRSQRPPLEDRA